MSFRARPLFYGFGRVVFAAIFGMVLTSPSASASCGDHVVILSDSAGPEGTPARKPTAPCTGPNCSDTPSTPPLAPVAPPGGSGNPEPIARLDAEPGTSAPGSSLSTDSDRMSLPESFRADIYHPPRRV